MKNFFTKKRIIWMSALLVLVLLIAYGIFGRKSAPTNVQTDTVKRQNLEQTVLTTGQVVSSVDLNLSFQGSGVVRQILVKEGDKVVLGQTLATLNTASAAASLTSAAGALAQARANYDRVVSGSTSEDVAVSKAAVASAQITLDNAVRNRDASVASANVALQGAKSAYANVVSTQNQLVANAYAAMQSNSLQAVSNDGMSSATVTVSGTFTGGAQGSYTMSTYETGAGQYYTVAGSGGLSGALTRGIPLAIGNGLFVTFGSTGTVTDGSTWVIDVPNTKSATYVTYLNAYESAKQTRTQTIGSAQSSVDAATIDVASASTTAQNTVDSAQAALSAAEAALALKVAAARPQDVATAQAQILSAQGQVQAAQANLANLILRAPVDGTITKIDVKMGEQATAMAEVMVLQDVQNLHAEANVSESNVAALKIDQTVDYTFDALGPDRHFVGVIQNIDLASTVVSGVVNYKVTASIQNAPEIKPGMTANMTILVAKKGGVLSVPSRAIINRDSKQYVRVIDDAKKKTYHEVEVQIGLQADGGLTEITSGVNEGQEIVTFIQS